MSDSCALCGKELFPSDQVYVQLIGWVPQAKHGQALAAKHESGAKAHAACVSERHVKMKRGIPVKQMGLF